MDLVLINDNKNELDRYLHQMDRALSDISPALLERHVWDKSFVQSLPAFTNDHIGVRNPVSFEGLCPLLKAELKLYWARLLSDPRMNSRSCVERRRLPTNWFVEEGLKLLDTMGVSCLADIPHPEFPIEGQTAGIGKRMHNDTLINAFAAHQNNVSRASIDIEYVKSEEIESKQYPSGRITVIGDFHKKSIIYREQFKPLNLRNIVFLNDPDSITKRNAF
jgi:hypothetical protein